MAWRTIVKRGHGQYQSTPIVGIRRSGISLNGVSVSLMGLETKDGIELLHDPDNNLIGFRKIKNPKAGEFIVKHPTRVNPNGRPSCFISASSFCKGLDDKEVGAFELKFNKSDDIWYVDLNDPYVIS